MVHFCVIVAAVAFHITHFSRSHSLKLILVWNVRICSDYWKSHTWWLFDKKGDILEKRLLEMEEWERERERGEWVRVNSKINSWQIQADTLLLAACGNMKSNTCFFASRIFLLFLLFLSFLSFIHVTIDSRSVWRSFIYYISFFSQSFSQFVRYAIYFGVSVCTHLGRQWRKTVREQKIDTHFSWLALTSERIYQWHARL